MSFKDAFITFPKLETERFILRELRSDDAKDYYTYFSEHEVTKYWGYEGPKNMETAAKTFTRFQNAFNRKEMITWGIATKDKDKIVGTCILNDFIKASMVNLSYNLSKKVRLQNFYQSWASYRKVYFGLYIWRDHHRYVDIFNSQERFYGERLKLNQ